MTLVIRATWWPKNAPFARLPRLALGLSAGEQDDGEESGSGRGGPEEVDRQPARCEDVGQREQRGGDQESDETEDGDDRDTPQTLSRLRLDSLPLLERPVAEFGNHEQAGGEERRCTVESRVVHVQLRRIDASEEHDRGGKQRRPPEPEGGNEHDERDEDDAGAHLGHGVAPALERQSAEPGGARNGSRARRYTRASLA